MLSEAEEDAYVEVLSFIVRQLTTAMAKRAVEKMTRRWMDGTMFPLIFVDGTKVGTVGSVDIGKNEDAAHEEMLMDFEYSEKVRKVK